MLSYAVVSQLNNASLSTKEVIQTVHDMKMAPSGGTFATIFAVTSKYPFSQLLGSMSPSAIAAGPIAKQLPSSLPTRLTGVRNVPDLGTLTTSLQGGADKPIVYRSSTLLKEIYGSNFHFSPWVTVRNAFMGVGRNISRLLQDLWASMGSGAVQTRWMDEYYGGNI